MTVPVWAAIATAVSTLAAVGYVWLREARMVRALDSISDEDES